MEKKYYYLPWAAEAYKGTNSVDIPEYAPVRIAHAVTFTGGTTLRMSGWPAIGPNGMVGKGDMAAQVTEALNHCLRTVEDAGGTWDNVIHLMIYFTDREAFWRHGLPARSAFLNKHSKTDDRPCITAVGVPALMHPDMLVEVEATAVF